MSLSLSFFQSGLFSFSEGKMFEMRERAPTRNSGILPLLSLRKCVENKRDSFSREKMRPRLQDIPQSDRERKTYFRREKTNREIIRMLYQWKCFLVRLELERSENGRLDGVTVISFIVWWVFESKNEDSQLVKMKENNGKKYSNNVVSELKVHNFSTWIIRKINIIDFIYSFHVGIEFLPSPPLGRCINWSGRQSTLIWPCEMQWRENGALNEEGERKKLNAAERRERTL